VCTPGESLALADVVPGWAPVVAQFFG
jgi:hypothetical protein